MTNFELDQIPDLVNEQKISYQQACIQIYKILYTHPKRFNLIDMEEDQRSDFLLDFLKTKTKSIFTNYNPAISPFGAYIFSSVQCAKISFLANIVAKKNYDALVMQDSINQYEEQMQNSIESVTQVAEPENSYLPNSLNEEIPRLAYKALYKKIPHRLPIAESTERRLKQGILLLALKSAWYINDSEINKVSSVCKIPPQIITDTVCQLKSNLINKALIREHIEKTRTQAFFYIHKYQNLLDRTEKITETNFNRLTKLINTKRKSFLQKTFFLQKGKYKIAPSNSEISQLTGIPEKSISSYIAKVKELDFSILKTKYGLDLGLVE